MLSHHDVLLSNGLRVVLVPQPDVHQAVASLYVRTGSRFESDETNGLSHFLEHMIFRGTATLPTSHAQALAFERLGGTLYAATHVDHGVMSVTVPPVSLDPVLALLGDVTASPRFTSIEVERGIVREEILEDLDDDGRDVDADNNARALMFEDHPLGYTITGGLDAIARFDEHMLRAHHARHYTAESAVLCVAGRIGDPDACARTVERCFGAIPRGDPILVEPARTAQTRPRFRYVENQSSQTDLRVAFRGVSERDPREPALEVLLRVLDDGMSTRLYERICDRLGLCYDVSALFETYEDDGVVDIAAGVQHDRATTVVEEILALVRELSEHGPTEDELAKVVDRHRWSVDAMLDDPEEMAGFYGLSALSRLARTPASRHAELEAVTPADVREAALAVFQPERLCVVAVGLLKPAEELKLERIVKGFS